VLHGRPLRDYLRSLAELDGGGNPDYFMPKFKEVLITFQTVILVDAVLFLKFFLILCVVLTSRRGGQLVGFSYARGAKAHFLPRLTKACFFLSFSGWAARVPRHTGCPRGPAAAASRGPTIGAKG
jgi:hypothetical protein